ncbi:SPOR domain-containing protein [Bradyrhizobium pachyrhizi]|uniref:SPOR domain-containing protein n=1 Tax=Bradyrhizobium pachyrhizi TaxID=280333 RepID=A0A844SM73_9BRAD|nr:SPOR domain-containing protein [Bradyrhizobium pachyrhizi]MVT67057.1 SPOR domain-containing protein [Bradyrhizobium pachyrhizi]
MADRYQDRHFPADTASKADSDPLAELARLIGQTDPFGSANKPPPRPLQSRANARPQQYEPQAEDEDARPAGPPPWMQRARQEAVAPPPVQNIEDEEPEQDYQPKPVHPLHRYAAQQAQPAPAPVAQYRPVEAPRQPEAFDEEPHYQSGGQSQDPSRYDDALYGQLEAGEQDLQRDPAYPDDPYAYEEAYEEEPEPRRRRSGLITVAAVLALGVFGVGGAYAYRTYVGSPRSGEPPIIKADNTPTKVIPAQADAPAKTPDRMATGDGTEKIVSREETPVDVNSKTAGPRVVFPPLNANANPPPPASVQTAQPAPAPITANGTLPNNEPRKVRTLSVKGDTPDGTQATSAVPAKPPAAAKPPASRGNPAAANASVNSPMSLVPGQAEAAPAAPPTRVASTSAAPVGGGGYLVQVSSQKNEADAQASYRTLQGKYRNVLGSQPLVVKRVDLGEKGVYYRAFAGPFASSEEASQVCKSLMSAGGPQCLIQRN